MNETNNKGGNKEFWGCVGAIGAALIIGTVSIIVALPSLIPFFRPSPTPTSLLVSETPAPNSPTFTDVPIAIPTSVSAVPLLTPTLPLSKFEFVSLQNVGIYESGNLGLQAGTQTLDNVDFQIGWLVTTQSQEKPNNSDKIVLDVQQISDQVSKVHFLLQAGWGLTPNNEIGTINLVFADGRRLHESLKLGYNIRDWSQINTSLTAPNAQEAWKGIGWDGTTQGVVDMLTINISSDYVSTYIIQIEIQDKSMENLGLLNPAIHLWAVTMER